MDASEVEAAWAEVTARWDEEASHRAFLDRCGDLDGLAEAGRRYRTALEECPADAIALRWRDEVVKRATALAMAQLPRTAPPRRLSPGARRALLFAVAASTAAAVVWVLLRLSQAVSAR
jgi:hypothetical protein